MQQSLAREFDIRVAFEGLPGKLYDNDRYLAGLFEQNSHRPWCGILFAVDQTQKSPHTPVHSHEIKITLPPQYDEVIRAKPAKGAGLETPLGMLHEVSPADSINCNTDPDGVVRSIPLISQVEGRSIPSLALRTIMRALGTVSLELAGGVKGLWPVRLGDYYTAPR